MTCKIFRINRPGHPCEPDENYSFKKCLQKFVARKIGCTMKFGKKKSLKVEKPCKALEQLWAYERNYLEIYERRKTELVNYTGCPLPCKYRDYDIIDSVVKHRSGDSITIMFEADEIQIESEEYVYDLVSFIAECGGALGLFLGFSFFMLWDLLLSFQNAFSYFIRRC